MKNALSLAVLFLLGCSPSAEPPPPQDLEPLADSSRPLPDLTLPVDLLLPDDLAFGDLATDDLGTGDLSQADLAYEDMRPQVVPPAAVWWSTGGGASTGSVTAMQGGFSIGAQWVAGRSTAASGALLTFGTFTSSSL